MSTNTQNVSLSKKALVMVIDGFGLGHSPDAEQFGDVGSNTFYHICRAFEQETGRALTIPHLIKLGLGKALYQTSQMKISNQSEQIFGAFGAAKEVSTGKDTPSGHWEMMGAPVMFDWGYFSDKTASFPEALLNDLIKISQIPGIIGNCHASGTEIIKRLGNQHINSGMPICYTSADSVFQVAAHEQHYGLDNLYRFCETARELLMPYNIGRVIARPFMGETPENFKRTANRKDYSITPPEQTLLDKLTAENGQVVAIGKIADIYAHCGITKQVKASGLEALIKTSIDEFRLASPNTLVFTNLVDFDQEYGHRRDPIGYGKALEYLDSRIPDIMAEFEPGQLLFFTSDHGCDPTWPGTEHTREFVPVLGWHKNIHQVNLSIRDSFADLGQTLAEYFSLEKPLNHGQSFLEELFQDQ